MERKILTPRRPSTQLAEVAPEDSEGQTFDDFWDEIAEAEKELDRAGPEESASPLPSGDEGLSGPRSETDGKPVLDSETDNSEKAEPPKSTEQQPSTSVFAQGEPQSPLARKLPEGEAPPLPFHVDETETIRWSRKPRRNMRKSKHDLDSTNSLSVSDEAKTISQGSPQKPADALDIARYNIVHQQIKLKEQAQEQAYKHRLGLKTREYEDRMELEKQAHDNQMEKLEGELLDAETALEDEREEKHEALQVRDKQIEELQEAKQAQQKELEKLRTNNEQLVAENKALRAPFEGEEHITLDKLGKAKYEVQASQYRRDLMRTKLTNELDVANKHIASLTNRNGFLSNQVDELKTQLSKHTRENNYSKGLITDLVAAQAQIKKLENERRMMGEALREMRSIPRGRRRALTAPPPCEPDEVWLGRPRSPERSRQGRESRLDRLEKVKWEMELIRDKIRDREMDYEKETGWKCPARERA